MRFATLLLFATLSLSAAQQDAQTFTGTVSDQMCAKADHSQMRMGADDAECTRQCVSAHGSAYVLFDGKTAYRLSSSEPLENFAGRPVKVVGTLDAKTRSIRVTSIALN